LYRREIERGNREGESKGKRSDSWESDKDGAKREETVRDRRET
jgi:hypothetical protein